MAAESFVVFTEHWSGMALLSREQRGDLLEALMAMHGACDMPDLDQATAIVLAMIRPRMEANRKRYEETVAKRKANGALGGRPSKKQTEPEKTLTLQEQPQGSENNLKDLEETIRFSEKPNGSAKNPVYGSDPDYVNTAYSDPPFPPLGGADADAPGESESAETDTHASLEPEPTALEVPPASPEQQAPKKKRKRKDSEDAPPLRPEDWERWYALFPRKEAKQPGVKAWNKAIEQGVLPSIDKLLEALAWQIPANAWTLDRTKYIPLPATYINARRWQDEPPIVTRASPGPQAQGVYGAPCQPRMKQPFSKADELTYVIQQNRINAAQALAELEAEDRAREMAQHEY